MSRAREQNMHKQAAAALLSAALIAAMSWATPAAAQTAGEKKLTTQQQRMKDCGAKWQDEKKAGAKGRSAYRKFMSSCLKKS
jgi:hypothetical protein